MRVKFALASGVVFIGLVAVVVLFTKNFVSPAPVIKENVSLVMLAKAMDRVRAAVGPVDEVHELNCLSKGSGRVTCDVFGSFVHRVSFASTAGTPSFGLAGQRTFDGKLYVEAFEGVPAEIPAREVDLFTSAFDGRATVDAK